MVLVADLEGRLSTQISLSFGLMVARIHVQSSNLLDERVHFYKK